MCTIASCEENCKPRFIFGFKMCLDLSLDKILIYFSPELSMVMLPTAAFAWRLSVSVRF